MIPLDMQRIRVVILAVAVILLVVIVMQNTEDATVRLLGFKATMPLAMLLGVILAGGFICGLVAALLATGKKRTSPTTEKA